MDQNANEDASGWETKGQERNLSFGINFGKVVQIHVSKRFLGYKEKNNKKKKTKEELQHVSDSK
jgi:hypothetical protein